MLHHSHNIAFCHDALKYLSNIIAKTFLNEWKHSKNFVSNILWILVRIKHQPAPTTPPTKIFSYSMDLRYYTGEVYI